MLPCPVIGMLELGLNEVYVNMDMPRLSRPGNLLKSLVEEIKLIRDIQVELLEVNIEVCQHSHYLGIYYVPNSGDMLCGNHKEVYSTVLVTIFVSTEFYCLVQ